MQIVSTHEFLYTSSKKLSTNPTNNVWRKYQYSLSMLPLYTCVINLNITTESNSSLQIDCFVKGAALVVEVTSFNPLK